MASIKYHLITPVAKGGARLEGLTYQSDVVLKPGQLVQIPLAKKQVIGVVMAEVTKPKFATKPIDQVLDIPTLPAYLLELADWIHKYYVAGLTAVWQTMLPTGLAKKRRSKVEEALEPPKSDPIKLTDEQTAALRTVLDDTARSYLLEGVTGSGKTELYLELTRAMLEASKSVIVLVPEIALTTQILDRFSRAFPGQVI